MTGRQRFFEQLKATDIADLIGGAWAANTAYSKNQILQYAGSSYQVTAPFTSGATFATDNLTLLAQAGSGFTYQGAWVTGTAYAVNDIVTYGSLTARCKTAHTSGVGTNSPPAIAGSGSLKWDVWSRRFRSMGAWAANTSYAVDDIVTNSGSTYRVTLAHTSPADFSTANLELWAAKGADGSASTGGGANDILNSTFLLMGA